MGKKDKGDSRGSSKKAKKSGSNVFDMFSQKQVAEFKDGFNIVDRDKDGIINKQDLRAMFDEIGRIVSDEELDTMLMEPEGPLNFTTFLTMFASKSSGEVDDDETIAECIRCYEKEPGLIDADAFRQALMAKGDPPFSGKEVDEIFENIDLDEDTNMIDSDELVAMLASSAQQEE